MRQVTLEQFYLAARCCPEPEHRTLLMKFCLLYRTKLVFQERAWYLEHKYLTPVASTRIRSQHERTSTSGLVFTVDHRWSDAHVGEMLVRGKWKPSAGTFL
uniref:Uncharacterized protein n=1 Tax=Rousettus aegyptiacus TaxID=9407 RepID=A0A7J8FDD1_ROUAE|nr:hypothetical protein HJG63_000213 [Rousettus aegyptiacus]